MKPTKRNIYMDHSATTYLDPRVQKEMKKCFDNIYANPSSLHSLGLEAKEILNNARGKVAGILNCSPDEVIFTSGGSESINTAIKGVAFSKGLTLDMGTGLDKSTELDNDIISNTSRGHMITSRIEHPAVMDTCEFLGKNGFTITYLNVDKYGLVNPADVEKAIRKDTILITIMYANNEIGTIQPIAEIGAIAKKHKVLFHTDACQAGNQELDVSKLNVDMMTLNGSKIYGPKGAGVLYRKKNIKLCPLIHGGGQEFGLRSGTENLAGIVGFVEALSLVQKEKEKENKRLVQLRDYLIKKILKEIPKSFLNGHAQKRLPNNVNISFLDIEGESILLYLNEKGIYVSTGSACSSLKLEISHVLDAIGLNHDYAHGSIRFTLGRRSKKKELDYVVVCLKEIVKSLRLISPIHLEVKNEK